MVTKTFHFEAMWVEDPRCKEIITRAWDCTPDGTPMYVATTKMKRCKKHLKAWSRDHFGNVLRQIKLVKGGLWRVEEASASSGNLEDVVHLKKELNCWYDKEEKMWQQWFRIQWLKGGNQNTNFFHGLATQRKRRNFIKGLRDGSGMWEEDEEVVSAVLIDYYS